MSIFEKIADWTTRWSGSTNATILVGSGIILWTIGGFIVGFTSDYQLVANTITTLMMTMLVFLLQRGQNKQSAAIQLKLNELLAATEKASNRMIGIENLTEVQVKELIGRFQRLAEEGKLHSGGLSIDQIPPPLNSYLTWMTEKVDHTAT